MSTISESFKKSAGQLELITDTNGNTYYVPILRDTDKELVRITVEDLLNGGSSESEGMLHLVETIDIANINTGFVIIPGVLDKKICIHDFSALVTGNFAGAGVSINIRDTTLTPPIAAQLDVISLVDGNILLNNSAGVTLLPNFVTGFTTNEAVMIQSDGALTGGTSITFNISYSYRDGDIA